jgi:hypothetical protein
MRHARQWSAERTLEARRRRYEELMTDALFAFERGDLDEAERLYEEALRRDPDAEETPPWRTGVRPDLA